MGDVIQFELVEKKDSCEIEHVDATTIVEKMTMSDDVVRQFEEKYGDNFREQRINRCPSD